MERINLSVFWTAMICCALLVITGMWLEERLPDYVFKIAGTFFVIGLANFLLWAPQVTYRFLQRE